MKRHLLLCAAALPLLFATSAKADDLTLSFSGMGIFGSISFEATATGSGTYKLDKTVDPTGSVTSAVDGVLTVIGFSNFDNPANKFTYPANAKGRYLSLSGLSFEIDANGVKDKINIFQKADGGTILSDAYLRTASGTYSYDLDTLSIAPTPTPEPGGLVLMGTSAMLGAGEMLRRRRSAA